MRIALLPSSVSSGRRFALAVSVSVLVGSSMMPAAESSAASAPRVGVDQGARGNGTPRRPRSLHIGHTVFFVANDGTHGRELWKTDGTAGGTMLVRDIRPGSLGSSLFPLAITGGEIYLAANDGIHGNELWVSDGTPEGTTLVKDLKPGSAGSRPRPAGYQLGGPALAGRILCFSTWNPIRGRHRLWASDGTRSGTHPIAPPSVYPVDLTRVGNLVFFTAGRSLWRTDGTRAGTIMLRRFDKVPSGLARVGGVLYFAGHDRVHGFEPWTSDGTRAGTAMMTDLVPGLEGSVPWGFVKVGNRAFFLARKFVGTYSWREWLFTTDGTEAGTINVHLFRHDVYEWYLPSNPPPVLRNTAFFQTAAAGDGYELWKSDGTGSGTAMVRDINPGRASSSPSDGAIMSGALYFEASDGVTGFELWRTDGSKVGTSLVKDINPGVDPTQDSTPGIADGSPYNLLAVAGALLFYAGDDTHGSELWRSDGTASGTALVQDIRPGLKGSGAHVIPELCAGYGECY